jgi:hypothetical protein
MAKFKKIGYRKGNSDPMKVSHLRNDYGRNRRAQGLEVKNFTDHGYGVFTAEINGHRIIYNSKYQTISCSCDDQFWVHKGCKHIRRFLEYYKEQEVLI